MEGDDTFQDVKESLDGSNMPTETPGRVLEPYMLVQDINVADGEPLILEWKVDISDNAQVPYAYDPKPNVKRKAVQMSSRLP